MDGGTINASLRQAGTNSGMIDASLGTINASLRQAGTDGGIIDASLKAAGIDGYVLDASLRSDIQMIMICYVCTLSHK